MCNATCIHDNPRPTNGGCLQCGLKILTRIDKRYRRLLHALCLQAYTAEEFRAAAFQFKRGLWDLGYFSDTDSVATALTAEVAVQSEMLKT